MEEEIWKDIPNYEGCYQVSNLGRVKSLDRFCCSNKSGSGFIKKGVILSQYLNKITGYNTVGLSKNNIRKTLTVHKIVFLAFKSVKSNNKIVIDHINNSKTDNRLSNLQLLTQRENLRKSIDKTITKSKYFGVYACNREGKWRVRIKINGDNISLGQKEDEHEASNLYNLAFNNKHLYNTDKKQFKEQINILNKSR